MTYEIIVEKICTCWLVPARSLTARQLNEDDSHSHARPIFIIHWKDLNVLGNNWCIEGGVADDIVKAFLIGKLLESSLEEHAAVDIEPSVVAHVWASLVLYLD